MLTLIKKLPDESWALCPFHPRPPTIEEYERNPQQYAADVYEHGIYKMECPRELVKLWKEGTELYAIDPRHASAKPDLWRDPKIKIHNHFLNFMDAHAVGNLTYNNDIITIIGVFKKKGSSIQFYPLTEAL